MNDTAIFEHIAQNRNCRAVQLADRLDRPLEDVQAALAGLIAVGDVIATPGISPAGSPCQLYDLTEAFKASAAYEPILAKTLAAQFAVFRPDLGKTDRAVAFVRERGMATSAELHAVLRLAPDEYASTYLKSSLNAGRLVKDGKTWTLGPKEGGAAQEPAKAVRPAALPATFPTIAPTPAPAVAPAKPDPLKASTELQPVEQPALKIPTFTRESTVTPTAAGKAGLDEPVAAAKPCEMPCVAADPRKPSRCRFALWSDGQIEIKIAGLPAVELSGAEVDELIRFVAKTNPRHMA